MALAIVFFCVCVEASVYLTPGSVIEEAGELWSIEDYLYIKVELECIENGPTTIGKLNSSVATIKPVLDKVKEREHDHKKLGILLEEIETGINRIQGKIDLAAKWFPGLIGQTETTDVAEKVSTPAPRRRKRAVFLAAGIAVGLIFATVAGVAITSLVKVTDLEGEVEKQGKKIEELQGEVGILRDKLNEAIENLNKVESNLEKLHTDFDTLVVAVYLGSLLNNIEQEINYIVDCVHTQAQLVRDASNGLVAPKLIPIGTLQDHLKEAAFKHNLKSLFTGKKLWKYYGLMRGVLTDSGVIAMVPMATDNKFHVYNIYPFPTFHHDRVIRLKANELVLLSNKRFYSCIQARKLDTCKKLPNMTVCLHPRFALRYLQPQYECCYELAMNATNIVNLDVCEFEESPPTAAVLLLQTHIATFFPEGSRADIQCQGSKPKSMELRGTTIFRDRCQINTEKFYYHGIQQYHDSLKAPEFKAHHIPTPGNLSYITIPETYSFKKMDKVVFISDNDGFLDLFTPKVRSILLIVFITLTTTLGLTAAIMVFRKQRRVKGHRRHEDHPVEQESLSTESVELEEQTVSSSGTFKGVNICHTSAH